MSLPINPDQIAYSDRLARETGLHFNSVGAWCMSEEPASRDVGLQGHNWLNLLNKNLGRSHGFSGVPIVGFNEAGFARFGNLTDAVTEAAFWVNKMSNYAIIRASRGKTEEAQCQAIADSPWDAGHYGGGAHILAALKVVQAAHIHGRGAPADYLVIRGPHGGTVHEIKFGDGRVRDFLKRWKIMNDIKTHDGVLTLRIEHRA